MILYKIFNNNMTIFFFNTSDCKHFNHLIIVQGVEFFFYTYQLLVVCTM